MFADVHLDDAASGDERALQAPWSTLTHLWIHRAANAIAFAISSSACLLDLDGVIIDGAVHRDLLEQLLAEVRIALNHYNWQGVMRPEIHAGAVGVDAKVSGAAYLPLHAHFAPAHDLFLKLHKN
jgi:predicted NBD/HSP70 family sugar kinase